MTIATALSDLPFAGSPNRRLYLAVGLAAGAVIALQIGLMRVFAVGSWAHFGSLVVSLAMLGFGLASVIMCLARDWFERHWRGVTGAALLLFGPLMVAATLIAQQVPFNPIFLVSDPAQKYRLLANFLLYLMPFLAGAFFLGTVFLKSREAFGRVYFADLTGSGLAGLIILGALYLFTPESIIAVPLLLWAAGGALWFLGLGNRRALAGLLLVAVLAMSGYAALPGLLDIPAIAVSQYKGVAYARNFPDAERIYRSVSPFGDLQVYQSSYMHFAPGLSDNAAFNLPEPPANTYVGMYIDGDGPEGIMRNLAGNLSAYYHLSADVLSISDQGQAGHLRRAVRRRHLDDGRAGIRVAPGHGRGEQPGGARRLPRQSAPRFHRRHPRQRQAQGRSASTAGSTSPTPITATT